jgi:hypothetical protein
MVLVTNTPQEGRAVAQAVSRWLPAAEAAFAPGQAVGFVVDKGALSSDCCISAYLAAIA